ncbi:Lecithin:cholesterol acyltransferase-domain-containing protein [Suillus paluster]|uniref:Lecithin:cholesterol acyltransferase-domain-containing protein n=1 Tax=Suillus paluster TaxID=48578 RepID=UPI001B876F87|nr:Lecithin:cholesterol acyltransferase-domain-containing protein [Suillus paluster]KAG1740885.1 Lecithin:cholesterol acyltransferase-domain-containing protein [Suillus paluster]
MSNLSQRTRTWSTSDAAEPSSDTSDTGKEQDQLQLNRVLVHDAQLEFKRQAKIFDAQMHKMKKERRFFVKARFLFPLGILLGILLGFILIQPSDFQDIHSNLLLLIEEYDISLKIPDIDLSRVELEWTRFRSNIPEVWKLNNDGREFQAGEAMKARGLTAHYPIVLVPGIVSTGLESWSTSPDHRAFFREKLWGGFNMVTQVAFNRDKWIAAMMLDPVTGLDPPGAKIRAAEGIGAASSFMTGYWIWSKVVENLAVVNYDTNNLHLTPYDWRLSMWNLEERDGYFSRLKSTIEGFKKRQGKKTVIAAHSMGSTVMLVLDLLGVDFKWVESPEHGGGGLDWVENHIESYITIGGTHLGVAKAMAAFLSGEMKDTVQMNPAGAYVLERFFSRKERQKLFCSWAGSASMWIKASTDHHLRWAPDDEPGSSHTHGELIAFRQAAVPLSAHGSISSIEQTKNMTADDASTWILERTPSTFQKMIWDNYSFGIERDEEVLKKNALDPRKWSNPLEVQLPNAPSMKIICVYGHGKETERSYWYAHGPHEHDESFAEVEHSTCTDPTDKCNYTVRPPLDMPVSRTSWIDADYTHETTTPKVRNGVKMGEGDGTVSLLSLGAMCVEGWKRPRWNPGGINVTTVEFPHQPVPNIPRGGANTSDHVDILGSTGLNELIIKVATGVGHEVEDQFVSRIREYARRVRWD